MDSTQRNTASHAQENTLASNDGAGSAVESPGREWSLAEGLVEQAPALGLVLDRAGRIVRCNQFTEELLGYAALDVIGHDWVAKLVPQEGRLAARKLLALAQQRPTTRGTLTPLVAKDGAVHEICWSTAALSGSPGAWLFWGCDVTELALTSRRAVQAERLAAVCEAMTGLAHESRNALQRSQANLEMLAREVEGRPAAKVFIDRIQRAQDDLHQLYEEVREYATPIHIDPQPADVGAVLTETWEALTATRGGRTAQLHLESGGVDLNCEVDCCALQRVFRKVLENSLAACGDPVMIEVRFETAALHGQPALSCRVRDNGPGLTPEARWKIFEVFYTTKTHGTGLGMALARRLIEAHGGQIEVGSPALPGAEFLITLPRRTR